MSSYHTVNATTSIGTNIRAGLEAVARAIELHAIATLAAGQHVAYTKKYVPEAREALGLED